MFKKLCFVAAILGSSQSFAGDISIYNFRETYNAYVQIFEMDPADADLYSAFVSVKNRLPVYGRSTEISGPMLLALLDLSGVACKKTFEKEKAAVPEARKFFASIDLTKSVANQTDAAITSFVEKMHRAVLQRAPTSDEVAHLVKSFKSLGTGEAVIGNSAVGVCALVASSIDFVTL